MASTDTDPLVSASPVGIARLIRPIDRVVLGLIVMLAALAVLDPELALRTVQHVAGAFAGLAPWFALSVAFAAAAKASGGDALIARAFVGREARMIPLAALVGGLTPFCSCGVIPLVAGLFGAGVPLAPVMAFWIASPLMDPAQFFVVAGSLGIGFAVAKTLAAVAMGVLAGYGTLALGRLGWLETESALRVVAKPTSCCAKRARAAAAAVRPVWRFWTEPERARMFLATAGTSAWFLARWLALAFAIESVMTAWVPPEMIARWLGDGPFAIPLAVAVGVPVYLNGLATVPLVAGLIELGMSPAAGLAFMLATTATGFAAMAAVWALVRPRVFALYLGFAVLGALAAGYGYAGVLALG